MKNFLILLLITYFASSCATNKNKTTKPTPELSPVEIPQLTIVKDVFDSKSSLKWIKDLGEFANCTIKKEFFIKRVASVISFDYSSDNGEQVFNNLINHKCTIRTYKSKNPWTKAVATTWNNNDKDLYLNVRRNPRKIPYMINTVVHECLHNVGYGHGDNKSKGKSGSVNHKVGKIAQEESKGCY